MKKTAMILLLCVLMLLSAVPTLAVVGGEEDPLISQSYAEGTFAEKCADALARIAEQTAEDYENDAPEKTPAMKTLRLGPGDSVKLSAGQQFVLLRGSAELKLLSGGAANVSAGRVTTGGTARTGNRYVLFGDGSAVLTAGAESVVSVSAGAVSDACPFLDLVRTDWYYADVAGAYQRGLINGVSAAAYAPEDCLTFAQAVKLAACLHQLYYEGSVKLAPSVTGDWYRSYVRYARENGIQETEPEDYDAAIPRGEFIRLFFNAMPEKEYARINEIMDGAIPDVATDAPLAKQVYTFYYAGILTGYSAEGSRLAHTFGAKTTITRAEVAAVLNRMYDPAARVRFSMK